jgi:hypothetical protein
MKNLLENVIRTFLFEDRIVAKIKSLSQKDLQFARSKGAVWAYAVLVKGTENFNTAWKQVAGVTISNTAVDSENRIAVGPGSKFADGSYIYVVGGITDVNVKDAATATSASVATTAEKEANRKLIPVWIVPNPIKSGQGTGLGQDASGTSNKKSTYTVIYKIGQSEMVTASSYNQIIGSGEIELKQDVKTVKVTDMNNVTTTIETVKDALQQVKDAATNNYLPPTDPAAWKDDKYEWYTDKGTGKMEKMYTIYRFNATDGMVYYPVYDDQDTSIITGWIGYTKSDFDQNWASLKQLKLKEKYTHLPGTEDALDAKFFPNQSPTPTPVTNPTPDQIKTAKEYRAWANSTTELSAKYGKSSKYDLDATSNKPYNTNFEKSYAAGKSEFDNRTKNILKVKIGNTVVIQPGKLNLYHKQSNGTFNKVATATVNSDLSQNKVTINDISGNYYYVKIQGKSYWISKSSTK